MGVEKDPEDETPSALAARWRYVRLPEPRFFDQATAAAYLGISERLFEAQWKKYNLPYPRKIGRRCLWDRKVLDQWADAVSGINQADGKADDDKAASYCTYDPYMSPPFPRKKRRRRM
ncbi:hypothetical protein [Blastomonas sp. CACIA14H2]|uniref:hypothetical protein n=1 Tax=Blastomonas sp. CACIA14H2 TaxID=1419876 RepID=UPI0004CFABCE